MASDVLESLESQDEASSQCCSEARNGHEVKMSYPRGTHMGIWVQIPISCLKSDRLMR